MSFHSGNTNLNAVVLDVGSGTTKMGWAGDDYPRSLFRSNVAVSREADSDSERKGRIQEARYDYYSRPILKKDGDGDYDVCNPIDLTTGLFSHNSNSSQPETVPDWYDLLPTFVRHGYETGLTGSTSPTSDHPLLLAERSYNPPATRQYILECLFEELNVPATFLARDAVLMCYGSGRTSATVVDLGYSGTTISPVFDGYVEKVGIRRNPGMSLNVMDDMILNDLDKLYYKRKKQKNMKHVVPLYQVRGYNKTRKLSIHNAARLFIGQECREHGAGVSINTAKSSGTGSTGTGTTFMAPSEPYTLPDGTVLDIPSTERFKAADLFFGGPDSTPLREKRLEDVKSELGQYLEAASSSANMMETEEERKQNAKEAVGIVNRPNNKRQRGGGGSGNNQQQQQQQQQQRPKRSMDAWKRAIHPHLQTLLDEQLTSAPLATMICDAAYRCDRDQQATLLGNVIVGGGGACIGPTEQAVPDTIKDSLEELINVHTPGWRVKVMTPSMQERAVLPWIGGSILGSLGTFHEMWISKADYEEWGDSIVNRKCP